MSSLKPIQYFNTTIYEVSHNWHGCEMMKYSFALLVAVLFVYIWTPKYKCEFSE